MDSYNLVLLQIILLASIYGAAASVGDRSFVYKQCMKHCSEENCAAGKALNWFFENQPFFERLLGWNCIDDCSYNCMWMAVDAHERDRSKIPQFHGKWPFVRFLGVQEPASFAFSILNFLANFYALYRFCRTVPSGVPMRAEWIAYGFAACNAWLCSTVFHARDTYWTEKFDYFSATFYVSFSLFILLVRQCVLRPKRYYYEFGVLAVYLSLFVAHCAYLLHRSFDYEWNMFVNVLVASLQVVGWMFFCQRQHTERANESGTKTWKCVVVLAGSSALFLLESFDFAPLYWTFDAHSLWHAGTTLMPLLWFDFAADDCLYLDRLVRERAAKKRDSPNASDTTQRETNASSNSNQEAYGVKSRATRS